MKKIVVVLMIFAAFNSQAQDSTGKKFDKTNFFTGGSVSFGLSSYGFNAGLHPHFGYTIARWLDVAAVTNFEYNSQKDAYDNKYHYTTVGIGAFTRIYPVRFAFLQVQPEYNFITSKFLQNGGPTVKSNLQIPSLLLGIGYTPSRSDKNTFSYFTLMVDVLKNINSPYVDGYGNMVPIVRAGFNIGLFKNKKKFD